MKRGALCMLLAACAAVCLGAIPQEYFNTVTATVTSASVGFGFPARRVTVVNDGSVSIYVDGRCNTATNADPEVKAGETYDVPEPGSGGDRRTCISLVSASSTASVRVYAYE